MSYWAKFGRSRLNGVGVGSAESISTSMWASSVPPFTITQGHRKWHRVVWMRNQSPITEADVDFPYSRRRRSPSMTTASWVFLYITSLWLDRSCCWFRVNLVVQWRTVHRIQRVLYHYWKPASNDSNNSNGVRWLVQLPWHHTPRFGSCARRI